MDRGLRPHPSPPPQAEERTLLRVTGLKKRFDENEVLSGIDLEVAKGDRIAILGASGSGKSTLLRCLTFMEMPSAGVIELDGKTIGRSEAEFIRVRQRVGMVFQQFNLFPHKTAVENVMEGLRTVKRVPMAQARERALKELERVGLADKAGQY